MLFAITNRKFLNTNVWGELLRDMKWDSTSVCSFCSPDPNTNVCIVTGVQWGGNAWELRSHTFFWWERVPTPFFTSNVT